MPRGGRGGSQAQARRLVDLSGTITLAEMNDLTELVIAITEKMHQDITGIFDSASVTPFEGNRGWPRPPNCPHKHDKNKENSPMVNQATKTPKSNGEQGQQGVTKSAHGVIRKEEEEGMTPQLQELKKEASVFLRQWQANITLRMRDLTVSDHAGNQGSFRGRGRGFRGGSRGGRGGGRGGTAGHAASTLGKGPARIPTKVLDTELATRCAPTPNHLWHLPIGRRKLILHIAFLVVLSLQEYNANSRVLMLHLTSSINVPLHLLQDDEVRMGKGLAQMSLDALAEFEERKAGGETKPRKWKFGLGQGTGSGGGQHLAQPLVDAGVGSLPGVFTIPAATTAALLGVMAENGAVAGNLFGTNPSRPTSKTMESYGREVSDFAFVPIHGEYEHDFSEAKLIPASERRLRLVIAISGWLMDEEDAAAKPWSGLGSRAEAFTMRWEANALLNLGSSLETAIKSIAWRTAKSEMHPQTIFSNLLESVWPRPLLKISKIMDNPWSVGMVRAEKAGAILADAVMRSKLHGDRPVSLVGYSLGARAIYACLMVLAERRQFGMVESVVMMGTPAPSESCVWLTLKSVVSGRLVNVYCEEDYILGFLYRTSNVHFGLAGLQEIQGAGCIENHRVDLVNGHLSYQDIADQVLQQVGWEDLSDLDKVQPQSGGSGSAIVW